ncbi:MAG: HlyD family efflux transporter periplasmic adaptor subunit [Defluviitaleaceae bacterium]|nr:HlyD family efflux transporter periplasmic adaptor subunit [Defluviitaleaceae bacterium]
MKKPIKFAIIGLIIIASIAGGIYYMMMPLPVRMTEVRLQTAELTFMEQGIITAENTVLVFPTAQGELNGLYVREGQEIRAGETLLSINDTALRLQLDQVRSGIQGLEAQLSNVGVEDALMRRTLQTSRNSLQGELQAINAQAAENYRAYASHQESLNEQMRIQQILIDQHQSELNRVQDNFQRVETLYQSGVATRIDLEAANAVLVAAETQLEAAQGQMAVIATGTAQNSSEHFEGIRSSINAQISGINQQLAQDTTTAARAHFQALIAVEQANIARLEHELESTTVIAPISGIITTLQAQHTNFVSGTSPVAEITVPGSLTIDVYVSTQDVSSIQVGDTVNLTLRQRIGDIEFYGRIIDIDNTAVVRLTALGIEERKVKVQVEPDIPSEVQLGIGHAVDVTFYVFREEGRLTVPRTAVFRDGGQEKVWAVQADQSGSRDGSGQVQSIPVVTGIELRTDIIIESGLAEGDFVINDANNQDLREGVRVTNEH